MMKSVSMCAGENENRKAGQGAQNGVQVTEALRAEFITRRLFEQNLKGMLQQEPAVT